MFFPGIFMGEDSEEMLRSFDCAPFVPLAQDDIFFGKGVNFGGKFCSYILRRTFLRRELCGWILMNEGRNGLKYGSKRRQGCDKGQA